MRKAVWMATGALLALAVAAITGLVGRQPLPAAAVEPDAAYARFVETGGRAEVPVVPDRAEVRLAVSRTAAAAAQAHAEASRAAQAVVTALRRQGLGERDLQTAGVSLQPEYDYSGRTPRLTGYRAEVAIRTVVRDVARAGSVIDAAVAAGANRVDGITFTVADPRAVEREALAQALADARARAEALARAAGVPLGRPLQVTEQVLARPPVLLRAPAGVAAQEAAMPVLPGELTISAEVRVRFALGE